MSTADVNVTERVREAVRDRLSDAYNPQDDEHRDFLADLADGIAWSVLAVVGQGATGEQVEQAEQAARKFVHERHPEWHDVGVGIVQGSHYRAGFAAGAKWWEQNLAALRSGEPAPSTTTEGESDDRR